MARAAQLLVSLRQRGPRPQSLPLELAPHSELQAYRIQIETMRRLGATLGGWKVSMNDASSGTCAPVFAADLYRSPATVSSPIVDCLGVEPEIAFSLAHDLPPLPAGQQYSRAQVLAAVAAAHAAIEVVVSRFRSHEGARALDRLADNISNGGLVVAAGRPDWRALKFATLPLRLTIESSDGLAAQHDGLGGHPLGDPLLALLWLVNHLSARGVGMHRAELVTTGSYAGLHRVARGGRVRVQFEGLEKVALESA